ncbi:MAG: hypothetical protein JWN74_2205 [Acidobacteriaceae bacterium]|nr:hypothetical protein [Acidobacteriaceae bacterium]
MNFARLLFLFLLLAGVPTMSMAADEEAKRKHPLVRCRTRSEMPHRSAHLHKTLSPLLDCSF